MAKYLIMASYTADGAKGLLKDGGTGRKKTVEQMIEKAGGKMEAFYFAFGKHDVFIICELPDAATAAAMGITINSSGMVTTSTVVLLTAEEVDKAVKKSVNYRAPGS